MNNNLFNYATKELSQDAFICYLLSFAMKEFRDIDPILTEVAHALIKVMISEQSDNELVVTEIIRQYKNIDILVTVNKKIKIIIEDKVRSDAYENQIENYVKKLVKEGFNSAQIHTVYFKIHDQANPEKGVINITRKDLLEIFNKYNSVNQVYIDYVNYLQNINERVESYLKLPINDWSHDAYVGFFKHLIEDEVVNVKENDHGWGYISNHSGGFSGFWWNFITYDDLENIGANSGIIKNIYLQIEDNLITVKLSVYQRKDSAKVKEIRSELFNLLSEHVNDFSKKTYRLGKYMTVGYLKYDENDYVEKIKILEKAIEAITKQRA